MLKCQERNSLLAQMAAFMHRRGCEEPLLAQQVQQLLDDATLQDYTTAFSPGKPSWDGRLEFSSKSRHQSLSAVQRDQSALKAPPPGKQRDVESERQSPSNDAEFAKNNFSEEMTLVGWRVLAKDLSSPVPTSPVLEGARGLNAQLPVPPMLNEGFNSEQVRKPHWVCV